MPLQPSVFLDALRKFTDPSVTDFAYAKSEDDARQKWGEAFTAYLATIGPIPPTPLEMPGIAKAFHDALGLAPALVGMPAATDYATAWSAAMTQFKPFDDPTFTTRQTTLRTTLDGIFAVPSVALTATLTQIVTAFGIATSGITLVHIPYL